MPIIDTDTAIELSEYLKPKIQGEIKFDKLTKALYSTDASIYQIEPAGVIAPKSNEDISSSFNLHSINDCIALYVRYNSMLCNPMVKKCNDPS